MPKFEEIDGDTPTPAEVTEAILVAAVTEAHSEVERIRQVRATIRETTPKGQVLAGLVETDDEFQAAVNASNAAEKALGRFRGAAEGQHVPVGTVHEGESV